MRNTRRLLTGISLLLTLWMLMSEQTLAAGKQGPAYKLVVSGGSKSKTVQLAGKSKQAVKTKLSVTPGKANYAFRISGKRGSNVRTYVKIYNKSGKLVASSGKLVGNQTAWTWDCTAAAGNKAGLPTAELVPKGSYRARITAKFHYKKRSYTHRKYLWIKVRKKAEGAAPPDTGLIPQNSWPWQVYLTGKDEVDFLADVVCQQVLTPSMSEYERAKALFLWTQKNLPHVAGWGSGTLKIDPSSPQVRTALASYRARSHSSVGETVYESIAGINSRAAYNGIRYQKGDCLIHSGTLQALFLHAGLPSEVLENGRKSGHGHHYWNTVRIGGKWFECDSDAYAGRDSLNRFLLGRKTTKKMFSYKPLADRESYRTAYYLVSKKNYPG